MTFRHYLASFILALVALGLSGALLPRSFELGVMLFRDGQFAGARRNFESVWSRGRHSAQLTDSLVRLSVDDGDVERGVEVLREYLKSHPGDVDARHKLAALYRNTQQPARYVEQLEICARQSHAPEDLRALAIEYPYRSEFSKQENVLREIVESRVPPPGFATRQDFTALAGLQAARGDLAAAARTLTLLSRRQGSKFDEVDLAFLNKLLIDLNRPEEAFVAASQWLARTRSPAAASRFASLFFERKKPDLADRLLQPYASSATPDLLAQLTEAEIESGASAAAFERLDRLRNAGNLPESQRSSYVDLALTLHKYGSAWSAAGAGPGEPDRVARERLIALPARLTASLAECAWAVGAPEVAQRMVRLLGAQIVDSQPSLAAEMALARNDSEAALRWVASAPDAAAPDQALANLFYLASTRRNAPVQMAAARRLYRRGHDRRSRELYQTALLASGPANPSIREELRVFLAARLTDSDLSASDRETLAQAAVDARLSGLALPALEHLARVKGGSWFSAYVEAASASGSKSGMERFLLSELRRKDLPAAARESRLQALLDIPAISNDALPFLREFAVRQGGQWVFAYQEALDRLGERAGKIAWLRERSSQPGLSGEQRRGLAFQLLDAGDKAAAEKAFLDLARDAPARSPDVAELLYLWGPRPPQAALDWLEERARASQMPDRARWMDLLTNAGTPARAVRLEASRQPAGPELDALLRALQADHNGPLLAEVTLRSVAAEPASEQLRALARMALQENQSRAARAAFQKLLARLPHDAEALGQAGRLAFAAGDLAAAAACFERLNHDGHGDAETYFLHAGILDRDPARKGAALAAYRAALRVLAADREKSPAMRLIEAQALARTGQTVLASQCFQQLLDERPRDAALRAEYASVLLQNERYRDAEKILARP